MMVAFGRCSQTSLQDAVSELMELVDLVYTRFISMGCGPTKRLECCAGSMLNLRERLLIAARDGDRSEIAVCMRRLTKKVCRMLRLLDAVNASVR